MRPPRVSALLCLVLAPSWASCRAQTTRTVHHMTDSLTLVESGDTLLWIRGPSDAVQREALGRDGKPIVMVVLFESDSTYVLLRGQRKPMNPAVARHVRGVLTMAREEDAGRRPKPKL